LARLSVPYACGQRDRRLASARRGPAAEAQAVGPTHAERCVDKDEFREAHVCDRISRILRVRRVDAVRGAGASRSLHRLRWYLQFHKRHLPALTYRRPPLIALSNCAQTRFPQTSPTSAPVTVQASRLMSESSPKTFHTLPWRPIPKPNPIDAPSRVLTKRAANSTKRSATTSQHSRAKVGAVEAAQLGLAADEARQRCSARLLYAGPRGVVNIREVAGPRPRRLKAQSGPRS